MASSFVIAHGTARVAVKPGPAADYAPGTAAAPDPAKPVELATRPLMLGPEGWTADVKRALRFHTEAEAKDWIAEESKVRRALFAEGAKVAALAVATVPERGRAPVLPDYDPHAEGRL